jgi:hypothetical protein
LPRASAYKPIILWVLRQYRGWKYGCICRLLRAWSKSTSN